MHQSGDLVLCPALMEHFLALCTLSAARQVICLHLKRFSSSCYQSGRRCMREENGKCIWVRRREDEVSRKRKKKIFHEKGHRVQSKSEWKWQERMHLEDTHRQEKWMEWIEKAKKKISHRYRVKAYQCLHIFMPILKCLHHRTMTHLVTSPLLATRFLRIE